jgi:hypothetical protein
LATAPVKGPARLIEDGPEAAAAAPSFDLARDLVTELFEQPNALDGRIGEMDARRAAGRRRNAARRRPAASPGAVLRSQPR